MNDALLVLLLILTLIWCVMVIIAVIVILRLPKILETFRAQQWKAHQEIVSILKTQTKALLSELQIAHERQESLLEGLSE